jgi:hypothetical protein
MTALCATVLVAACGGTGDDGTTAVSTDAAGLVASTLLDDDGGVMPSDARAASMDAPAGRVRHHATAAQAADLQRALGAAVRRIEVGCCGQAAVAQAIAAGLAQGEAPHGVLVSGEPQLAIAVVDGLGAAGLERVWWILP